MPLTKNKERIQKFKETENSQYIFQNELDKACFQHDMVYADFKNLPRRTASVKKFNIAENAKEVLLQWFISILIKKLLVLIPRTANKTKQELTEEIHEQIIRKFEKQNVHSSLIDNIWVLILPICN